MNDHENESPSRNSGAAGPEIANTGSIAPQPEPGQDPELLNRETDAAVQHALGETLPVLALPVDVEQVVARQQLSGTPPREDLDQTTVLKAVPSAEPAAPSTNTQSEKLVLDRKHPLAIRWMHWINFPVLFTMMWSGLLIYWNDSDNAYLYPHRVYRVGIGKLTLFRFFPDWLYANHFWDIRYHVTQGLSYHFFFMWLFAINGIAYVIFLLWSKEWKFIVPQRRSIRDAIQVTLVDLHLKNKSDLPLQTKYNGGQRIAYTSVIVMGFGSLVTGLAIYKPTQTHLLTTILGGYEMARWLHFWLTLGFCGFFLVHVGQVILAGWNNFRSMVSGYELHRSDAPVLEAERRKF